MWHWNSLWAPAPGDPPAIDDPVLWKSPWSMEQTVALQARGWEAVLSATNSWWTTALTFWPLPTWPQIGQVQTPVGAAPRHHLELVESQPSESTKTVAPRKRSARPEDRHSLQTRKR